MIPVDRAWFATTLVAWQRQHGRHGLPWQWTRDPYRVWLSEVMLQQTQVATVLGYFGRFLEHFATVRELADAPQAQVFALWSGLGYYSRAKNLHACAQMIRDQHGGEFPQTQAQLQELPGIGPSTAAAIASFCFSQRASIFDGNVKRVLARVTAFDGDVSQASAARPLNGIAQDWVLGVANDADMPHYTQGLMDLGATVCTARNPSCASCPIQMRCEANARSQQTQFPVKRAKIKRSAEHWRIVVFARRTSGGVVEFWLTQRPPTGIWASLFTPSVELISTECFESKQGAAADFGEPLSAFNHVLTHKDLHLEPWLRVLRATDGLPSDTGRWYASTQLSNVGLPKAIKTILDDALKRINSPPG